MKGVTKFILFWVWTITFVLMLWATWSTGPSQTYTLAGHLATTALIVLCWGALAAVAVENW